MTITLSNMPPGESLLQTASFDSPSKPPKSPPERTELAPLLARYHRLGHPPPSIQFIDAADIPLPYRSLLAHSSNMTPKLERYCQRTLSLRVFEAVFDSESQTLDRWIALMDGDTTMEFGSIRIHLTSLPHAVHGDVLRATAPFASILIQHGVRQICRPSAFFAIQSDEAVRAALNDGGSVHRFYGRCNTIETPDGTRIATVVEILPRLGEPQSL